MERSLLPRHLACMASGLVGGVRKYYFFAQGEDDTAGGIVTLAIGELTLTDATRRLSVVIKASTTHLGGNFLEALKEALEDAFFIRDLEV